MTEARSGSPPARAPCLLGLPARSDPCPLGLPARSEPHSFKAERGFLAAPPGGFAATPHASPPLTARSRRRADMKPWTLPYLSAGLNERSGGPPHLVSKMHAR